MNGRADLHNVSLETAATSQLAVHQAMNASALIFGSTGAVGRQVLQSLLSESNFAKTCEIGRRKTTYPSHGVETPSNEALSRLNSVTVPTAAFEDPASIKAALPESNDWISVFITLGTTRAVAGSAEAFVKIDRDCEYALMDTQRYYDYHAMIVAKIVLCRCYQRSKSSQA